MAFCAFMAPRTAPLPAKLTPADLKAARNRTIDDIMDPGLRVLFCGINPGLYSGATGWHFARPGNRFWPALHRAGFTHRQLHPSEQHELLGLGMGVTNLVPRTTATADELSDDELRAGGVRLRGLVRQYMPGWLAVVGVSAYRVAFGATEATVGRQTITLGETGLWVLPNTSGINAHYQLPRLVEAFAALRDAAFGPKVPPTD